METENKTLSNLERFEAEASGAAIVAQTTLTRKKVMEGSRKCAPKRFIITGIVSIIVFVLGLGVGIWAKNWFLTVVSAAYLVFLILYHTWLAHYLYARRLEKQYRTLYKSSWPSQRLAFTDSCVYIYNTLNEGMVKFDYDTIMAVSETKDALLLRNLKAKTFITVDKDGFEKGSPDELKTFLMEKNSSLQLR